MLHVMEEEKAVIVGHHLFYEIEYIEDVINGGMVMVSHIYNDETKEQTTIRQVICNEWYQLFRTEAYKYNDSNDYCHNYKQLIEAFKKVTA